MLHYIPQRLSLNLAAKVAGVSTKAFKQLYVKTGLCKYLPDDLWHDGTGRGYIWYGELQKALGRELTLQDYQEADRKLEARRQYQRTYRRQRSRQQKRRRAA